MTDPTPLHDLMRECGLTAADFGATRMKRLMLRRAQEFYRLAIEAGYSTKAIGRFVGRDHSTVIHGARQSRKRLADPTPQIAPPTPQVAPTPTAAPSRAIAPPPSRKPPGRPRKPPQPKKPRPGWFRLDGLVDARYISTDEAARARGCWFVHRVEFRTYRGFGSVGEDGGMAIRMCRDEEVPESVRSKP